MQNALKDTIQLCNAFFGLAFFVVGSRLRNTELPMLSVIFKNEILLPFEKLTPKKTEITFELYFVAFQIDSTSSFNVDELL